MKSKWKCGDLFLVPLSEEYVGLGQIADVLETGELYLVLFGGKWKRGAQPNESDVAEAEPILASLALDAKLWHGDWPIIGNVTANLVRIRRPTFKIRISGIASAESLDGKRSRRVTTEEEKQLQTRTTVAPICLQDALQAHHGLREWQPYFDELRYSGVVKSSEVTV